MKTLELLTSIKIPFAELATAGLNLQAVYNLVDLPQSLLAPITKQVDNFTEYRQLILLGHAGGLLWQQLGLEEQEAQVKGRTGQLETAHPIDEYAINKTRRSLAKQLPETKFKILYPIASDTSPPLDLQGLGELVGWHQPSPLKIGINQQWGTWFAYRVALLADSRLAATPWRKLETPCQSCKSKDCIKACPANAVSQDDFNLTRCVEFRKLADSPCRDRCLARMACPVAKPHQYSLEQIQYHYGCSMQTIDQMD